MGTDAQPRHPQVTTSIEGFPGRRAGLAGRIRELVHEAELIRAIAAQNRAGGWRRLGRG